MVLKEIKNGKRKSFTPLKSPSVGGLTPNDDERERAWMRSKRHMTESRRSLGVKFDLQAGTQAAQGLTQAQVQDLVSNCLKLASENKITTKNTWSLNLIDHMEDLVKAERHDETNFQRASVTLEAGVKIYSYRVDSVHHETFRMLTGIARAAGPGGEQEEEAEEGEEEEGQPKKKTRTRKVADTDPNSTLESTEAITMARIESSSAVDPLFTKTSAQFDEGGARGLLLLNLSVWGGSNVVFDSAAVPERVMDACPAEADVALDLSSLAPFVPAPQDRPVITPSLSVLRGLLNERQEVEEEEEDIVEGAAGEHMEGYAEGPLETTEGLGLELMHGEDDFIEHAGYEPAGFDDDDDDDDFSDHGDDGFDHLPPGAMMSVGHSGEGAAALEQLLAATQGQAGVPGKGWAGALHWRFHSGRIGAAVAAAAAPREKKEKTAIDFEDLPELDETCFAPGRPKDINLAKQTATKVRGTSFAKQAATEESSLLPTKDYRVELTDLTRLLTKPHLSVRTVLLSGAPRGPAPAPGMEDGGWGSPGFGADGFGDDDDFEDAADFEFAAAEGGEGQGIGPVSEDAMVMEAPRKVEKVSVKYDRVSKQVDVRALKHIIWDGISNRSQAGVAEVDFMDVLQGIPELSAAGQAEDLSVHLCFICALHLCNEHSLSLSDGREAGVPDLSTLRISDIPHA